MPPEVHSVANMGKLFEDVAEARAQQSAVPAL
jgi:hypothetical protein